MVESCIVMVLLCVILFGLLQTSYVISSRNVINYASIVSAHAAAVGLDVDMVNTVSHYATIPTAGPVAYPSPDSFSVPRPEGRRVGERWDYALSYSNSPRLELGDYEVAMREKFHLGDFPLTVLNYENWSVDGEAEVFSNYDESAYDYDEKIIEFTLSQRLPLVMPFSRVIFAHLPLIRVSRGGRIEEYPGKRIDATTYIENHAKYYLKDVQ